MLLYEGTRCTSEEKLLTQNGGSDKLGEVPVRTPRCHSWQLPSP